MFQENRLKRRVAAGEQVYGAWLGLASASVAELIALVGFDFVIIDQEHGAGSLRDAADMLRACDAAGYPAAVRVPWNDHVYLKRILDLGAQSLMIPMNTMSTPSIAAISSARCAVAALSIWTITNSSALARFV